jgi:hypothetical protein
MVAGELERSTLHSKYMGSIDVGEMHSGRQRTMYEESLGQ